MALDLSPVTTEADLQQNLWKISQTWTTDKFSFISPLTSDRWIKDLPNEARQLVFTSYFTGKPDPQGRAFSVSPDEIHYLQPWYDSVHRLQLSAVVFHDELSADFTETYTSTSVRFVKCCLGPYSLNDERFLIYLQYLVRFCPQVEHVLMTDGSDVRINKDPFQLIASQPPDILFVGRNDGHLIRHSRLNRDQKIPALENALQQQLARNFYNQALYNAGILGGSRQVVLYQLYAMRQLFLRANSSDNHNMMILNYTIYQYWLPLCRQQPPRDLWAILPISWYRKLEGLFYRSFAKQFIRWCWPRQRTHDPKNDYLANTAHIRTSHPLCSPFKAYAVDSEAYLIHK